MKIKFTIPIAIFLLLFSFSVNTTGAHSGRTDSSGGHNCNVGACAGTYHYHNGGYAPAPAKIYFVPTATPTLIPTNTPTPTLVPTNTPTPTLEPTYTPTPTIAPTSTPTAVVIQAVEEEPKENTGFWGFILSLFGL